MLGSAVVYAGLAIASTGLLLVAKPLPRLGVATRSRAIAVLAIGVATAACGLFAPVTESRVDRAMSRLDRFAPAWQFREVHSIRIAASPARVFEAIHQVRADEIFLFQTLTWIRRGGRALGPGILNPGVNEPLIDLATRTSFVRLADAAPRELVVGTIVVAPKGARGSLSPLVFQVTLPPGFALAAMNFLVTPDGAGGSNVTTETRVYANSPAARRSFAIYWRLIYPGSALIRRMWLRAIAHRALA